MNELTKRKIVVRYSSVDGHHETKSFAAVKDAQAFAHHWIGAHPDNGSSYAVSDDGVGKITVSGARLTELFPPASDRDQTCAADLRRI